MADTRLYKITLTGDEYVHSSPDTNTSTRNGRVVKKGSSQYVYAVKGSMYLIGGAGQNWISSAYAKIVEDYTGANVNNNPQPNQSPNPLSPKTDALVMVGAGFLVLIILKDVIKKVK